MKKIKYLLWLAIIGLAALAVFQNKEFFIVQRSFGIDLYFFSYDSPELPTAVYYLAVFLIGFLVSYFSTLPHKFRSRRTVRQLNEKIAADEKKIARLEKELAAAPRQREGGFEQQGAYESEGPRDTEAVEEQGGSGDEKTGE